MKKKKFISCPKDELQDQPVRAIMIDSFFHIFRIHNADKFEDFQKMWNRKRQIFMMPKCDNYM